MNKINVAWHEKNPMPKNPTLEQSIEWHLQHIQNCAYRNIPIKLKEKMKKRKIKIPV